MIYGFIEKTPWYLRILGYKPNRRIAYDHTNTERPHSWYYF